MTHTNRWRNEVTLVHDGQIITATLGLKYLRTLSSRCILTPPVHLDLYNVSSARPYFPLFFSLYLRFKHTLANRFVTRIQLAIIFVNPGRNHDNPSSRRSQSTGGHTASIHSDTVTTLSPRLSLSLFLSLFLLHIPLYRCFVVLLLFAWASRISEPRSGTICRNQ